MRVVLPFYLLQKFEHKMAMNYEQLYHYSKLTLFKVHKQLQHIHQHKFQLICNRFMELIDI